MTCSAGEVIVETVVWWMRHGEAEDPDTAGADETRRLTTAGRQTVSAAARWLSERVARPDIIWHSPLVRTTQTARLVSEGWSPEIAVQMQPDLAPGMQTHRVLAIIDQQPSSIICCVGHQPDIGRAIADCVGGGHFTVTPGTIAAVGFRGGVVPGAGQLLWLATPDWFCSR
jgi:phosphohistidine phosphatase